MSTGSRGHLEISSLPEFSHYGGDSDSRTNAATYSGDLFLSLQKGWSMNVSLYAGYSHNNKDDVYESPLTSPDGIRKTAKDNSWQYQGYLNLSKQFGIHTVSGSFNYDGYNTKVNYLVPSYKDRYHKNNYSINLNYSVNINKVRGLILGSWHMDNYNVNGMRTSRRYPLAVASIVWSPSWKHQLKFTYRYSTDFPGENIRTENVFQTNEFLWSTGNSEIKSTPMSIINLYYTWLPSNKFSMTAYYIGSFVQDRINTVYAPYEGKGVISRIENNGDSYYNVVSVNGSLRLFSNMLQLYGGPTFETIKKTGFNSCDLKVFSGSLTATFYMKSFYLSASYSTPMKRYANSGERVRDCSSYSLLVGWSKGDLRIQAGADNLFRKRGLSQTCWYDSPYYSSKEYVYSPSSRDVFLTVQYTFDYGKKINRGDEVGKMNGAASGIF